MLVAVVPLDPARLFRVSDVSMLLNFGRTQRVAPPGRPRLSGSQASRQPIAPNFAHPDRYRPTTLSDVAPGLAARTPGGLRSRQTSAPRDSRIDRASTCRATGTHQRWPRLPELSVLPRETEYFAWCRRGVSRDSLHATMRDRRMSVGAGNSRDDRFRCQQQTADSSGEGRSVRSMWTFCQGRKAALFASRAFS